MRFWLDAADYQLIGTNYEIRFKDVIKILISVKKKSRLENIFLYSYRRFLPGEPLLDNFGILFLALNQTSHLCVQPIGLMSEKISTMHCKNLGVEDITKLFTDLLSIPVHWRVDAYRDNLLKFDNVQRLDFNQLVYHPNPFNPLESSPVYNYILQTVFRHANASVIYDRRGYNFNYGARLGLYYVDAALSRFNLIRLVPFKFHGYQFLTC